MSAHDDLNALIAAARIAVDNLGVPTQHTPAPIAYARSVLVEVLDNIGTPDTVRATEPDVDDDEFVITVNVGGKRPLGWHPDLGGLVPLDDAQVFRACDLDGLKTPGGGVICLLKPDMDHE